MKRLFWLLLVVPFLIGCERPRGFTLKKIVSQHPNDPRWNAFPLSSGQKKELSRVLSRPFTYLGSGNHCYAFLSQDGQYVLKFFKQKHMRTQSLIDYLPTSAKALFSPTKRFKRRQQEREKSFTSYKIAYEHLKKETGIFYLHLNKTSHLNQIVTLIDQHQVPIQIDIDQMEFLIQKKANLGYQRLNELFSQGQKEEALECVVSLMNIIARRLEKGFFDKDIQFFKNFGFIGNEAIEIDIGEFRVDPIERDTQSIREEVHEVSLQLMDWVATHYPVYQSDVGKTIQDVINQIRE